MIVYGCMLKISLSLVATLNFYSRVAELKIKFMVARLANESFYEYVIICNNYVMNPL